MLGNILNWIFGIPDERSAFLALRAHSGRRFSILASVLLVLLESYAFLERLQTVIVGLLLGSMLGRGLRRPARLAAVLFGACSRPPSRATSRGCSSPIRRSPESPGVGRNRDVRRSRRRRDVRLSRLHRPVSREGWGAIGLLHGKYEIDTTPPPHPFPNRHWRRKPPPRPPLATAVASRHRHLLCQRVHFQHVLCDPGGKSCIPSGSSPPGAICLTTRPRSSRDCTPPCCISTSSASSGVFRYDLRRVRDYSRTAFDCLMPISEWFRRVRFENFRRGIVLYCASRGWCFCPGTSPENIVTPAAIVGGVFTCGLWCLAMLWAEQPLLAPTAADAVAALAAGPVGRGADGAGPEGDLGLCGRVIQVCHCSRRYLARPMVGLGRIDGRFARCCGGTNTTGNRTMRAIFWIRQFTSGAES